MLAPPTPGTHRFALALLTLGLTACAADRSDFTRATDPTDAAFDPDHVLQVDVELTDPDWAELRDQGRTLADLCSNESPYEYFTATVTVDGMRFENVEVRKKGFFGSLSSARPSLKLRFAEDLGPYGLERMTLNNDNQDPSHLRTCLTYRVMDAAGVPAPRCNHARVSVNGEDLGVFTHVDSMNKPFLRLYFEDEDGALFEGQLGDFTAPYLGGIQSKTEEQPDREFLADLQEALERSDEGDMLSGVSARVDVDAFLSFWSAEALVGQWDGYSNNRNNWFAYRDPINSKLYFMPWGPDAAFAPLRQNQGLGSINGPLRSVFTTGRLSARLFEVPSIRRRYEARMQHLLDTAWDEDALLAEVARVTALLGADVAPESVAQVQDYIRTARADIEAELEGGLPAQRAGLVDAPICLFAVANVSGTFDTTFDTLDLTAITEERATVTWSSDPPTVNLPQAFDAVAGVDPELMNATTIRVLGVRPSGQVLVLGFVIDPALFESGAIIPLGGLTNFAAVVELTFRPTGPLLRPLGLLTDGVLTLDEIEPVSGGRISGSFSGVFYEQR
ncbi:MAG: CotH kinase family protein [Sandaracinaceae bacterium]|nr:CotH kinase family protein [Sandaracinaceae bacterium]